ncbi:integral membrane protein [Colletotrichum tabaci]|uniref:Integral membrane protein n=1 Tax=Colletotrichum tabaci TaxID=1209068 RepID=A0AAV9TL72_9PEZI
MVNIVELLGKADNLSDPEPALNSRPAVLGMVISFLLTSLLLSAATCSATNYGLGKHFISLGIMGIQDFIRAFYICNGAYPMATALIKLALLFQYLRMFEPATKSRYVTLFFIVFTAAWGVAYSFSPGFESHVGINVALDLIVFAIPIPLFLRAGLLTKTRWSLFGLFIMGVLVNILGIFRLIGIFHTRAGTYPTLDPAGQPRPICASLPVFWPTLQKNLGQIFITKEVEITSEIRRFSTLEDGDPAAAELGASRRAGRPRPSAPTATRDGRPRVQGPSGVFTIP